MANTPKITKTDINYDKLIKIHRDTKKEGFSWIGGQDIKAQYSLRNGTLEELQHRYGIPMIHMDRQTHAIYSLPALEYVLEHATILHGTHHEDTAQARLDAMKAEEEDKVRERLRNEFEAKISTPV